jgi:hypothetical protein
VLDRLWRESGLSYELANRGQLGAGCISSGADPLPEVGGELLGDVIAQYGGRWRIEGILAEDARFTAQQRSLNGRASGPILRATDVGHLSKLLADADRSVRNSSAG